MGKVSYNYSASEPGDGCFISIFVASIVLLIVACIVLGVRYFVETEQAPASTPQCPTHSCMYDKS